MVSINKWTRKEWQIMICHCIASEFSFSEPPDISTLLLLLSIEWDCNWDSVSMCYVLSNYSTMFIPLGKCEYYFWPWEHWDKMILAWLLWGLTLLKQRVALMALEQLWKSRLFLIQVEYQVVHRDMSTKGNCRWSTCTKKSLKAGGMMMFPLDKSCKWIHLLLLKGKRLKNIHLL